MAVGFAIDICQFHTAVSGKLKCRVQLIVLLASNNTDGLVTAAFPCRSGGIEMVGISTTKGKQGVMVLLLCGFKIVFQLAPLVAAKFGVNQVFAFNK